VRTRKKEATLIANSTHNDELVSMALLLLLFYVFSIWMVSIVVVVVIVALEPD